MLSTLRATHHLFFLKKGNPVYILSASKDSLPMVRYITTGGANRLVGDPDVAV